MDSEQVHAFAKRRGFYWPSYDIYGGSAGFFDYGPMGSMLLHNIVERWRQMYIVEEGMLEIDAPSVGLEEVFRASGHLGEFTDFITTCESCRGCYRADHLLDGIVENPDSMNAEELQSFMMEKEINCPGCGGVLSRPEPFNLMFRTNIGPGAGRVGYMRPETAQGIFVAFQSLVQQARKKLPFGVVQVGKGYRNEISPRQGLLRQREFHMAEAEVFFNPEDKKWVGMKETMETVLFLVDQNGVEHRTTAKDAFENEIIGGSALAYFVALTQRFLLDVGLDPMRLRFRQHLRTEMAHYASDCWDAEALLSYGWIELVGIADRGCYDLEQHMRHSGVDMRVFVAFSEPRKEYKKRLVADLKRLGPLFKGRAKDVAAALESTEPTEEDVVVDLDGEQITVPRDCFRLEEGEIVVSGEKVLPHVVEPSYGLDRIFYSVLDHNLEAVDKGGEEYRVLRLPPWVAPVQVGIFPLVSKPDIENATMRVSDSLKKKGMMVLYDSSGSIGRRYARADEIGIPWCITVDHESLEDGMATVRNRDTGEQTRVSLDSMSSHLSSLMQRC